MLLKSSERSRRIWIDMLSLSLALDHPEPDPMPSQYYNLTCTQLKKVQITCFLQDLCSCKTTIFLKRKVGEWQKLSSTSESGNGFLRRRQTITSSKVVRTILSYYKCSLSLGSNYAIYKFQEALIHQEGHESKTHGLKVQRTCPIWSRPRISNFSKKKTE